MPDVKICDVTLRDGMQVVNRDAVLPLALRHRLAEAIGRSGLPYVEIGSFVHPQVIPAMRDTAELLALVEPRPGQELAVLAPNLKYYRQLREAVHVDTVALLASASESYSRVNTRLSSAGALDAARQVAEAARADGYRVRAYLSYAFREMEGAADARPAGQVEAICRELLEMGCELVALSDTDGRATPGEVRSVLAEIDRGLGLESIGVHLHDRYGTGLASALVAYEAGVRTFDACLGGIGGNKLLENSVGNIATEELVYLFHGLGVTTGVDFEALLDAGRVLLELMSYVGEPPPPSKLLRDLAWSEQEAPNQPREVPT